MVRLFVYIALALLPLIGGSQIKLSTYSPDFGLITKNSDRFVDVTIKNTSGSKAFIFRVDAPREYAINFSSKVLEPDSIRTIRIKYNPIEKGFFTHDLKLHLSNSDQPKTIKTSGFVKEFDPNSHTSCPSFQDKNVTQETQFELRVMVVEKLSQQPIKNAKVNLILHGENVESLTTNANGMAFKEVPLGLYYTIGSAESFISDEYMAYVNRGNNFLKYELTRTDISPPIEIDSTDFEEEIVIDHSDDSGAPSDDSSTEITPEIIDTSDFSVNKYAANNIVFCVDISSSMKYTGRLDLLKASMIELTNMLRPIDNITIVAYASEASTIMETTSAENKEQIIQTIKSLEAKGNTAGIEGMKLAYSKACSGYIHKGNNEVIMATDGGFNKGKGSTKRLAKKYANKDIKMSVVGIKVPNNYHVESMKEVAGAGDGVYIPIKSFEDAQKSLVEEIKRQSSLHGM